MTYLERLLAECDRLDATAGTSEFVVVPRTSLPKLARIVRVLRAAIDDIATQEALTPYALLPDKIKQFVPSTSDRIVNALAEAERIAGEQ